MSPGFPFRIPVRARYLLLLGAMLASLAIADLAAAEPEEPLPHATETVVFCESPVGVGIASRCTVEVFDGSGSNRVTPRGTITFGTDSEGTFSNGGSCGLLVVFQGRSRCQLTYTPHVFGPGKLHRITAVYPGQLGSETRPPLEGSEGEGEISTQVPDPTATTLACERSVVTPGRSTTCTATLRNTSAESVPSSRRTKIFFSTTGPGSFSAKSCPARFEGGLPVEVITCEVTYTSLRANPAPTTITAAYEGDEAHIASQGSTPVRDPNTVTVLSCAPPVIVAGHGATCTAMVEDPSALAQTPTGTVEFTTDGQGAFDEGASCTLGFSTGQRAFCQLTYTPSAVGSASHELTAVYRGDAGHDASEDVTQVGVLSGVVRYAEPGGTGFDPCENPARPCPLERAADRNSPETTLAAGDEIVMAPGTYSGDHDLGPERTISLPNGVFLHGAAGQPLPVIDQQSTGAPGAILVGANDHLSRFEIRSDALRAITFLGDSAIAEGLIVRSSGSAKAVACDAGDATKLIVRDSACLATGPGSTAFGGGGISRPLITIRLRNVTAISTGAGSTGLGARVDSFGEGPTYLVDGVGVIAKGADKDVVAEAGAIAGNEGARVEIQLRRSDYATTEALESDGGVASVTPAGTLSNIVQAPLLAPDQVHQILGSPTVDRGATDTFSGTSDVDGGRRAQGRSADIGADEFAPNSTTTLSCDPSTVKAGDASTCRVTVIDERGNPSPPGGPVLFTTEGVGEFSDGGTCTLNGVPGDRASCQVSYETNAAGPHRITAIYQGGTHEPSQASTTVAAIDKDPTETELSCAPGSVEAGRAVHCTATVTDTAQEERTAPSGTVTLASDSPGGFSADPAQCTLAPAGPDSAGCQLDYTPGAVGSGTHNLEAAYGSDQRHAASAGTFALTVTQEGGGGGEPDATETTLLCVPDSVVVDHETRCRATVRDTATSGATTPTGTVGFTSDEEGTFSAGSCSLSPEAGNQASCVVIYTPTAIGSGSHRIAAGYGGDATHLLSQGIDSVAVTAERHPTATTLSCAPGSVEPADATRCTATVRDTATSGATTPTGSVAFDSDSPGDLSAAQCSLTPAGPDSATCQVDYTARVVQSGTHRIGATYGSDPTHTSSTGSFGLAVGEEAPGGGDKVHTVTTLLCAPGTAEVGHKSRCVATVRDTAVADPSAPSGSVSFDSDSTGGFSAPQCTLAPIGPDRSRCLVDYTPGAVQSGTHHLEATYGSDQTHASSAGAFDLTAFGVGADNRDATVTTLACSPSTVIEGERSTCTATVRDTDGPRRPTGTVEFEHANGGFFSPSPSCELVPAGLDTASCEVGYTPAAPGAHGILSLYTGDDGHDASVAVAAISATERQGGANPTSAVVECEPASVEVHDASTCEVTVEDTSATPSTPTGTVSFASTGQGGFSDDATCTLAAQAVAPPIGEPKASCQISYTPAARGTGIHRITTFYAGDPNHDFSLGGFDLTVTENLHDTRTALSCEPGGVEVGEVSTCTVAVIDASASPTVPTGSVDLSSNAEGEFGGTCSLAPASPNSSFCTVGYRATSVPPSEIHDLLAEYPGDGTHRRSQGSDSIFVVPSQSRTQIACSPDRLTEGETTTCTATVSTGNVRNPNPIEGSVELRTSGRGTFEPPAATCTLSGDSQSASCSVEYTSDRAGRDTIEAISSGDDTHQSSRGSTEVTFTKHATTTALSCEPAGVEIGQASTCTATVVDTFASPATPTGLVEFDSNEEGDFSNGGTCVLSAVTQDTASCTVDYKPTNAPVSQTHTVHGEYAGDDTHEPSEGTDEIHVDRSLSRTQVACDPDEATKGDSVTCTVTVSLRNPGNPHPIGGDVRFSNSLRGTFIPDRICTLSGDSQSASCSVDFRTEDAGHHLIEATYSGDDAHLVSNDVTAIDVAEGGGDRNPTAAELICQSPVQSGTATTCTATVEDTAAAGASAPEGTVVLDSDHPGAFEDPGTCQLTPLAGPAGADTSACDLDYTPSGPAATHTLEAQYPGDDAHSGDIDTFDLTVTEAGGGGGDQNPTAAELLCQSPVASGTGTTCVVTVEDTGSDPSAPTGTVGFQTGSPGTFAAPGTCDLTPADGPAGEDTSTCQIVYSPVGPASTHTLEADYPGDDAHSGDTDTFDLTVTEAGGGGGDQNPTAAELICQSPVQSGTATTCTATVEDTAATGASAPEGTVVFDSDHPGTFEDPGTCQLTPLAGPARADTSACDLDYTPSGPAATHSVEIDYPGDEGHSGDIDTFDLTVTEAGGGGGDQNATATTVECNPATLILGGGSVCTVVVEDTSATGANSPSGPVDLQSSGEGGFANTCDLAPVAQARARCQTIYNPTAVGGGTHQIDADYDGDSGHQGSTDSTDLTVTGPNGGHDTATTVECEPATVILGGVSICTVNVKDLSGGQNVPRGAVVFGSDSAGDFSTGGCLLFASGRGEARCQLVYKPFQADSGVHQITAIYPGDAGHEPSQGTDLVNVLPPNGGHQTSTALECRPESIEVGSETTCTATVTDLDDDATPPTRAVVFASDGPGAFSIGGCQLGVAPTAEEASCSFTYTPSEVGSGTHRISAAYEGDNGHEPSPLVSDEVTVTPVAAPPTPPHGTATTVACAPASVLLGGATTCTATVADTGTNPSTPSGAVGFTGDSQGGFSNGGSCTLAGAAGKASCQVTYTASAIGTGTHRIAASYQGDGGHEKSQGTAQLQVTAPVAAPNTIIKKKPRKKGLKRKAKFKFVSDQPGSTFQCKLDRKPFKPCRSPFKKKVRPGRHTFRVRAVNPQGIADPTPAMFKWKVRGR